MPESPILTARSLTHLVLVGLLAFASLPATAFAQGTNRCQAWLALRAEHGVPGDAHSCHQKERDALDVMILPRAHSATPGADFEADVVVWLGRSADALAVRISGGGVLAGTSERFERAGGFAAGDTFDFSIRADRENGDGSVLIHVTALGEDGSPRHAAASEFFVRQEGQDSWWSDLGMADLLLQRARQLAERGQLDASGLRAAREAAVGSTVDVDTRPIPDRPRTHLEKQLDTAFPSQTDDTATTADGPTAAAAANITVRGQVLWHDIDGNPQPAPIATVEIWDEDIDFDELVETTSTDSTGHFEVTVLHDDGVGQGDPDLFVRVVARSSVAIITPDLDPDNVYFVQSPVNDEVATGTTLDVNFLLDDHSKDSHTAFSVHTGLIRISWYTGTLVGSAPSQLRVRYPHSKSAMSKDGSGPYMKLRHLDRFDWDVLHHEFGHYVSRIHGLTNSPGGDHSSDDNLEVERGSKDIGVHLAWGEGWPTFFAVAGQVSSGSAALGIPNVGDVSYTDSEDTDIDYSLETGKNFNPGKGEDNERSVMTFMWDMFDAAGDGLDQSTFSDRFLFGTLKAAGAVTLGDAWEAIAATQSDEVKASIGGALSQARVAPTLILPHEPHEADSESPPTFEWRKQGAGPNPLNDFRIVFFDDSFSHEVFDKELGDVSEWTPTQSQWTEILETDTVVKWVVQGKDTDSPITPGGALDHYWSSAYTIGGVDIVFVIDDTQSMSEEIDSVKTALQAYITEVEGSLDPGEEPPTIQLITFKDRVAHRVTSNDLNEIRDKVADLVALGGASCPEFSAHALLRASRNVANGGTVLFATDASAQPGVDVGGVVTKLRAKGVTVNTILSGDCLGIGPRSLGASLGSGIGANPNQLAASGEQKESADDAKPDDGPGNGEDPDEPIPDDGQPPIDLHGNDRASASRLLLNGDPVVGSLEDFSTGEEDNDDYFVIHLEEGGVYTFSHRRLSGLSATVEILDEDTQLAFGAIDPFMATQTVFTPPESGDYYVHVKSLAALTYRLSVTDDVLPALTESAVDLYSTISAETGGAFLVRDDVNDGNTDAYVAAIFNVMATTLGPAVVSANPDVLPRNTELALTLTGGNSNWRSGSGVSFSGGGIDVKSVEVLSPTSIQVLVELAEDAKLSFRDVTVTTPIGGRTEIATGSDVIEVRREPAVPTTLSVEPSVITRDHSQTLLIRGVKTHWEDGATVEFLDTFASFPDAAISVDSVDVLSKTLIEAQVTVASNAELGFRSVRVTSDPEVSTRDRAVLLQPDGVSIPELDGLSPSEGLPDETFSVGIAASLTHFVDGVTTASFGAGIQVLSVSVDSATTATVEIAIDAGASPGFRDVVLRTGDEFAARIDGFFVGGGSGVGTLPENGKFSGCLAPGGEALFAFDAPVDRAIGSLTLDDIKIPGAGVGKLKGAKIVLIDPLGGESTLGKLKKGKKLKKSDIRLTLAGEHLLAIRDTTDKGGCYAGKAKVEASQASLRFAECLAEGESYELSFSVLPDSSILKLVVEAIKKKGKPGGKLVSEVSLESPSSAIQEIDAADPKKLVIKNRPLDEEGDWRLTVAGLEGDTGCFEGSLKLQQGTP